MSLEKIKQNIQLKVDSLEQAKKIQTYYIKQQFNTGRNKGYEHRQKLKVWMNYYKLLIISFLAVGIVLFIILMDK